MCHKKQGVTKPLAGVIVPIVTPVNDSGELDGAGLGRVIDHVISNGAHGVFVLGSTGEFASMTKSRHIEVVESARPCVPQGSIFTAGISCCCLAEAIESARVAADLGAGYVVSTAPYYQLYRQEDIQTYFGRLADASAVPVVLYNLPAQTGITLETPTVLALSEHPNIVGLKESSPDVTNLIALCSALAERNDFALLSGRGNCAAMAMLYGASGLVPALANIIPDKFRQLYDAARVGDFQQVMCIQQYINRLYIIFKMGRVYDPRGGPTSLKVAMSLMGLCGERRVQLPVEVTDVFRKQVADLLVSCDLRLADRTAL